MPRIPIIEFPRRQYPRVPATLGDTGEGLRAIGETIKEVGKNISDLLALNAERQNRISLTKVKNYILSREMDFANQIRNDPNYHLYQDSLKAFHEETIKGVNEITKKIRGGIDPKVSAEINGEIEKSYLSTSFMLAQKEDQMFRSESIAEFMKSTNTNVQFAANSDDPKYVTERRKELEDEGQSLVDANYLTPPELVEHLTKFDAAVKKEREEVAFVKARELIRSDPKTAAIDLRAPNFLPDLEPKVRQTLIDMADAGVKQKDIEAEKLKKEERDDVERDLAVLLWTGKLTPAKILEAKKILTGDEIHGWMSRFKQQVEEPVKKTDAKTYMDIWGNIYDNPLRVDKTDIRNQILLAQEKKLLSDSDAQELNRAATTEQFRLYNTEIKASVEYMRTQFIPKSGQLQRITSTPEQWERFQKAVQLFETRLSLLIMQKKPITRIMMQNIADELVQTYAPSMGQLIEELTTSMKAMGTEIKARKEAEKKGTPLPMKPKPSSKRRLPGETIGEWKVRTGTK